MREHTRICRAQSLDDGVNGILRHYCHMDDGARPSVVFLHPTEAYVVYVYCGSVLCVEIGYLLRWKFAV